VISGAGPTLLALCTPAVAEAVGEAMVRTWEREGVSARSEVLGVRHRGSHWEPLPPR
jgi:homoserine kinase